MGRPYQTSPADRLVAGTALHPRGLNDEVLRGRIGHTTGNIRLTPTAATVVGSASYNFGKVDDRAIGTYRLEWQGAASADAEPLGNINRVEFTIYENTAGVYLVKINRVSDLDGGLAAAADGHEVNDAADGLVAAGAIADNTISLSVLTSGLVTTALTANKPDSPTVGDLYLNDASAASTRVFSLTRLS